VDLHTAMTMIQLLGWSPLPLINSLTRALGGRCIIALSEKTRVRHLTLYTEQKSGFQDEFSRKFEASLDLMYTHDPLRLSLVSRYIKRVRVGLRHPIQYWPEVRTSVMSSEFVLRSSPAYVAHVLVYHAVQARFLAGLHCAGVAAQQVSLRIDWIATKAQLSLAQRLPREEYPNAGALIDSLHGRLESIASLRRLHL
jgi:hypothetical protein